MFTAAVAAVVLDTLFDCCQVLWLEAKLVLKSQKVLSQKQAEAQVGSEGVGRAGRDLIMQQL